MHPVKATLSLAHADLQLKYQEPYRIDLIRPL